jgi:hypothetical protein
MSAKKKTSRKSKKKNLKPKVARKAKPQPKSPARKAKPQPKPTLKEVSLTAPKAAAAPDDPIGACQYYDNSGQLICIDNITKSECAKYRNSVFLVGETCE